MSAGKDRLGGPSERGSVSIEAAIVFGAVIVGFFSLMIGAGRVLSQENKVRSAAHAAARAASLEGTYGDAATAATATATANLADADAICEDQTIRLTSNPDRFAPGGLVQVEVSCRATVLPFGIDGEPYVYLATEVIDEFRSEP